MIIYPAIDIQNGRCVRLKQGDFEKSKEYMDPIKAAKLWRDMGARYLHVIDLDGAKSGFSSNISVVEKICSAVDIPVQLGGGLRDIESIKQAFLAGVKRVVLGTVLVYNPGLAKKAVEEFGVENIVAGIDIKNGNIAVEGWQKESKMTVGQKLDDLYDLGIDHLIVTDIASDGMQKGPSIELIKRIKKDKRFSMIASGGVTTIADIKKLASLGCDGAIIGTAIYEGSLDLKDAIKASKQSDLTVRIVPCLDVKDGRVVKGINFVNLQDAGDPVELASVYDKEGADELVFLDITASYEGRSTTLDMASKVAEKVFIPYTVGGGIRKIDDMRKFLATGCDKVAINTAAVKDPQLIKKGAKKFGSQCIVVAVDAKRKEDGNFEIYIDGGRTPTGKDALEWVEQVEELGAGEILLTSMDRDGTKDGFDIELTKAVTKRVNIPVIASGGAGKLKDFTEVAKEADADALLAASLFHYGELSIKEVKKYLKKNNIAVRL